MSYKAQGHEALEEGDKGRYFDDKRRRWKDWRVQRGQEGLLIKPIRG